MDAFSPPSMRLSFSRRHVCIRILRGCGERAIRDTNGRDPVGHTYLHFDQTCLPSLDNGYRPRGSTECNHSGAKEMCDTDSVLAFDKRDGKLSTDGIATTPTLLHSSNHTFGSRDSGLTYQGRER